MTPPSPQKLADNIWVMVVARFSMIATPFVMALIAWLGLQLLNSKLEGFQILQTRVSAAESRALNNAAAINALQTQIAVLQSQRDGDRQKLDELIVETNRKLDSISAGVNALSREVGELAATQRSRALSGL